jgi:hypothetical protein
MRPKLQEMTMIETNVENLASAIQKMQALCAEAGVTLGGVSLHVQCVAPTSTGTSLVVSPAPPDLLKVAMQRAEAKGSGDRFTVRDLFSKKEWGAIESTKRLGKLFKLKVDAASGTIAFSHLKGTQRVYKKRA